MYASIDLLGGKVVRLRKGRPNEVTVYSTDPVNVARSLSTAAIAGLHIVDLDSAFSQGNNLDVISRVIRSAGIPVQVGGGVRSAVVARKLVEAGADALVVGTTALTNETTFGEISATAGQSRVIAALDYVGDNVLIEGWRKLSGIKLQQALDRFMGAGLRKFLLTCSDRDGMMEGPDVETIRLVCQKHGEARVFASGGVRSTKDIVSLRECGAYAVIVGKAFLEGTLSISEALRAAAG